MSLSDVLGHMDLSAWPQAALVLFLAAFLTVCLQVLRGRHDHERLARLPLEDTK